MSSSSEKQALQAWPLGLASDKQHTKGPSYMAARFIGPSFPGPDPEYWMLGHPAMTLRGQRETGVQPGLSPQPEGIPKTRNCYLRDIFLTTSHFKVCQPLLCAGSPSQTTHWQEVDLVQNSVTKTSLANG